MNRDTVSFGCRRLPSESEFLDPLERSNLSAIPNITCMYCGTEILSDEYMNYIKRSLKTLQGTDLAVVLDNKRKYIKGKKRIVADKIKYEALRNKKLSLEEIVQKLTNESSIRLTTKQNNIIVGLNKRFAGKFKNTHDRLIFANLMADTQQWIQNNNLPDKFKRKKFLDVAGDRLRKLKDRKAAGGIMNELKRMPTSKGDPDAFIVKYAERSIDELIESLFFEAKYSEDHVIPRCAYKSTSIEDGRPEEDSISNIAIVCRHCNNVDKGGKSFNEYAKDTPNLALNITQALDNILNSKMAGSKEYVKGLAQTIEKASEKEIILKKYYND